MACETGYILSGKCAKAEDNANSNDLYNDDIKKGGKFTKFLLILLCILINGEKNGEKKI